MILLKKYKSIIITVVVILMGLSIGYILWPKIPSDAVGLYFFKEGKLAKIYRTVGEGNVTPEWAMRELLAGPGKESLNGYITEIPKGTELVGLEIDHKVAYANFSRELESYGGGTARVRSLVAQIVYTLTEFPDIEKVKILLNGSSNVVLGSEGLEISDPLSRKELGF